MSTINTITIAKDIIVSIAALVTACAALKGLRTWRVELEGKAHFEAARDLMRATYTLRDEIEICRSPFISVNEFPSDYTSQNTNTAETEGETYAHIYGNRWKPVLNAIKEFDSFSLEAEALWGDGIKTKTNDLRTCYKELQVAIEAIISDKYSGGADFTADSNFAEETKNKAMALKKDENQFSIRIATAIEEIENEMRPHLHHGKDN